MAPAAMQRITVFSLASFGSLVAAAAIAACSGGAPTEPAPPATTTTTPPAEDPPAYPDIRLPAEPQRPGDPVKGREALLNEAYVPCGVPDSAFSQLFGAVPPEDLIADRQGRNATLPYNWTATTTKDGVALVTSNCLQCHAGRMQGKLVVGLGAADADYTQNQATMASVIAAFVKDPKEQAELAKWEHRMQALGPYAVLSTRGPNPADEFTAVLFSHHDPQTLAWTDTPVLDVPSPVEVPIDVPPWWRMRKKTSMFYTGAGRGDHARIMMTASVLCTSSVEESQAIDATFPDIRAYIASLDAPKWPFAVDAALAARGRPVFEKTCSRCHGTYGDPPTYPNKVVVLEEIGTDGLLATGAAEFAAPIIAWYKQSFFGQVARLEPQRGYVAPPLDGVWATAPYLHNGSVPTMAALLDSTKRPTYWNRSFDSNDYDPQALGWRFVTLDHGKSTDTDPGVYDTTRPGYANTGHTFGDALTDDERTTVLEYLKTL
jgi:mono/diheme cytochrome c family protein